MDIELNSEIEIETLIIEIQNKHSESSLLLSEMETLEKQFALIEKENANLQIEIDRLIKRRSGSLTQSSNSSDTYSNIF